jgi:type VI secretion system protein ImpB
MSKASKPPKERVNIIYRSGAEGAAQDTELPLKMLVMGDFTRKASDTAIGERHPVRVDKDNFNAVMRSMEIGLDISVPHTAGEKDEAGVPQQSLPVHLDIHSLKDLEPEGLCAQVEPLKELLALRQALVTLKGPLGNVPAFRRRLQALLRDDAAREQLSRELGLTPDDHA